MSYRAGMYGILWGVGHAKDPRIICDGCGAEHHVYREPMRLPYAWFMDGKAPPGWTVTRTGGVSEKRDDRCPKCQGKEGDRG